MAAGKNCPSPVKTDNRKKTASYGRIKETAIGGFVICDKEKYGVALIGYTVFYIPRPSFAAYGKIRRGFFYLFYRTAKAVNLPTLN